MQMRWRLSLLLALVWAVQGAFWPLLAVHLSDLGIAGRERGWIFATLAIGSLVMPLGAGHVVDRVWPTERLLALIYALGTVLLGVFASGIVTHAGGLFALFLLYWLLTAPAVSLSASLVLRHLRHPREEFGRVRLWGTFGWMSVGWLVAAVLACAGTGRGAYEAFWVAAGLSLLLVGYCLTLPHTPPLDVDEEGGGTGPFAALGLLREPGPRVVLLAAFGFCLTTPFVYQVIPPYLGSKGLSRGGIALAMSLAQWPEIAALAVLPWLFRRLGDRATLALGIAALALRFGLLALDLPLWVAVAGMPLHGVSIGCFLVGSQIYVDGHAPARRRASAQALLTVLSSGVGSGLGSLLAGEAAGRWGGASGLVFVVPCVLNGALLIYFGAGFRSNPTLVVRAGGPRAALGPDEGGASRGAVARVGILVTESADG